ncbi:MAG: hypothetical protein HC836_18160 [Richelia sp. RM2_1_2]|nr:hypothetical protein [Richelia sp. SM2_1_7]NJM18727.1 hypothetical protein [Richelia sp. SM1_7_0]NJN10016.1 hypothetical protein [Richelia sp. RM1_1_1]NJO28230.1 hypothetical protein [Richelia sp. SL_2_1]NJO60119.1 hypothetical protein [Richelia sp. RM2_1_2]NJS16336.1 hypothetical protein [Nostocaceae cyanobacterium CSU_2_110]
MKYNFLQLIRKITLAFTICLLVFSITSCTNNQTTSPEIETTQTPAIPNNSPSVETTPTPSPKDDSTVNELPPKVKSAVLSDATKRVSKPLAALRITQAQKQSWGDSCLGLAQPDTLCAQVIVPGWKVVVTDGERDLVYRTDEKGKQVKLED